MFSFVHQVGMAAVHELLAVEATVIAGPKGKHAPGPVSCSAARCTRMRNVRDYLPEARHAHVMRQMRQAYASSSPNSERRGPIHPRLRIRLFPVTYGNARRKMRASHAPSASEWSRDPPSPRQTRVRLPCSLDLRSELALLPPILRATVDAKLPLLALD